MKKNNLFELYDTVIYETDSHKITHAMFTLCGMADKIAGTNLFNCFDYVGAYINFSDPDWMEIKPAYTILKWLQAILGLPFLA